MIKPPVVGTPISEPRPKGSIPPCILQLEVFQVTPFARAAAR
jgi:hypothetical protein